MWTWDETPSSLRVPHTSVTCSKYFALNWTTYASRAHVCSTTALCANIRLNISVRSRQEPHRPSTTHPPPLTSAHTKQHELTDERFYRRCVGRVHMYILYYVGYMVRQFSSPNSAYSVHMLCDVVDYTDNDAKHIGHRCRKWKQRDRNTQASAGVATALVVETQTQTTFSLNLTLCRVCICRSTGQALITFIRTHMNTFSDSITHNIEYDLILVMWCLIFAWASTIVQWTLVCFLRIGSRKQYYNLLRPIV